MKQRRRNCYTESQKALAWERWRQSDSLQQVDINVGYFKAHLRDQVKAITFKEGGISQGYGPAGNR
jgi:hypothetical protein